MIYSIWPSIRKSIFLSCLALLITSLSRIASHQQKRPEEMDPHLKEKTFPFMSCVLEVNVYGPKWQKILAKILSKINGVRNFRMDDVGRVEVSGTVDPVQLLKALGKAGQNARICKWQFGHCSSYLYLPTDVYSFRGGGYSNLYGHGYRGGGQGSGLHFSDRFASRSMTIDKKSDSDEEDDTLTHGTCCRVM